VPSGYIPDAALPRDFLQLGVARFIGGIAIGIASMLAPLYIAEVAPARIRGRLVSLNQMAVVTGILLAYLINWGISFSDESGWRTRNLRARWRTAASRATGTGGAKWSLSSRATESRPRWTASCLSPYRTMRTRTACSALARDETARSSPMLRWADHSTRMRASIAIWNGTVRARHRDQPGGSSHVDLQTSLGGWTNKAYQTNLPVD